VVAAAVGGLPVAVRDGVSGALVSGHDVGDWADSLDRLLSLPAARAEEMGRAAAAHAANFSWENTTDALLASYRRAIGDFTALRQRRFRDRAAMRKPRRWTTRRGVDA
jgi:D-inositol-3-phosphate glycosyltransferase